MAAMKSAMVLPLGGEGGVGEANRGSRWSLSVVGDEGLRGGLGGRLARAAAAMSVVVQVSIGILQRRRCMWAKDGPVRAGGGVVREVG